ncbi:MAG TPA: glycosyltransferase family 4 protein [Blastocatellia bacterium]|nr:glycosyltransferase family 4 protein [Blastocatellia bacterium]
MKILQVCSADAIGGGEHHVIDLTRGLLQRGHELHLAVRPNSPLRADLADAPIHWHEVKLRNALDVFSAKRLATIITQNKIEVVHAHVARDYPMTGLATRYLPVRFFLTRHHFNPLKSSSLYESTISHAAKLIAVSETVRHELAKAFPTMEDHIEVIPNWLRYTEPVSRTEARKHFGIKRCWAIAVLGQITPLKRQDLFLEAVRLLTENNSYERAEFFIIGTANPEEKNYEEKLRDTAREIGLADRVHFTGFVPDLPKYLAAFDIVVAPSDNEGFSLATIEAMNAGCAVLASEVGGLTEIIMHNETGILFQPGNAEMIAVYMRFLLFDSHARNKLTAAAQASVRARFDREQVLNRIEALYQSSPTARDIMKNN